LGAHLFESINLETWEVKSEKERSGEEVEMQREILISRGFEKKLLEKMRICAGILIKSVGGELAVFKGRMN
jgi:hypothetical protein